MNRHRLARASLFAGIAFTALTVVLLVFWLTYHPDSQASFYCTLGDQGNCAIVQQEQANRLLVYYAMVTTGLISLVSFCTSALATWL